MDRRSLNVVGEFDENDADVEERDEHNDKKYGGLI